MVGEPKCRETACRRAAAVVLPAVDVAVLGTLEIEGARAVRRVGERLPARQLAPRGHDHHDRERARGRIGSAEECLHVLRHRVHRLRLKWRVGDEGAGEAAAVKERSQTAKGGVHVGGS